MTLTIRIDVKTSVLEIFNADRDLMLGIAKNPEMGWRKAIIPQ